MRPKPYEREIELAKSMRRGRRGKRQLSPATAWSLMVIGLFIITIFLPPFAEEVLTYRRQAGAARLPSATGEILESRARPDGSVYRFSHSDGHLFRSRFGSRHIFVPDNWVTPHAGARVDEAYNKPMHWLIYDPGDVGDYAPANPKAPIHNDTPPLSAFGYKGW